ncbi:hypothetical protein E4U46_001101 [Claviceps purpurea]|nr:hypothetical protein E4U46_001101 [Claviceps purpurea]
MIYPASTLILATLVFNAASVLGAPVRIPSASPPVARALADDPVLPRKVEIVDVPARMRSLDDDPMDARSAPEIDIRDTASSESIEARDPLPEVEEIVRRYPRKVYHDFYQKRSQPSAPPEKRAPEPDTPQIERRFPRRSLYERYQKRSEPASPPVEARAQAAEPPELQQRRYPRKVYADYYEKRSTPPSPPEQPVAREPAPEPETVQARRFPREVYMKHYERRQADPVKHYGRQAETPESAPADATTPDAATPPTDPAAAPAQPSGAAVSGGAAVVQPPQASSPPVTPLNSTSTPLDVNALFHNITSNDAGFQPGTTIQETTVLVHKITHISEPQQKPRLPPPLLLVELQPTLQHHP